MASISQDKRTQRWFCFFRFGGKPFNKSTGTKDQRKADQIRVKVEENLDLLKRGKLELPPSADLWHWLISDGKRTGPISLIEPPTPPKPTFSTLFDGYFASLPPDTAKRDGDQSHRDNMIRHTKHFIAVLGDKELPLSLDDWQTYIGERSRGKGGSRRRKTPTRKTIEDEVATVRMIYRRWAIQNGSTLPPTDRQLKYPTRPAMPQFKTWLEIEQQIKAGGLSKGEVAELWDALYLTPPEIRDLLDFVKGRRRKNDFFHPVLFTAAMTGARSSELRRMRISEVQFDTNMITVREKKKQAGQETLRHVQMTPRLAAVLRDWIQGGRHPGGQLVFCRQPNVKLTARTLYRTFKKHLQRTRYKVLRGLHLFRHSFASNLAASGVDQRRIDLWMGHQTEEMRKRYQHLRSTTDNPLDLLVG
ncbi:MAG: site-specific integrase [Planctomycetes bacterium]|nr:site-specific integrase [Planctomycetota bacterium]